MALDDFTDIDDETLGGLGDLFDEPAADVAAAAPLAARPAAATPDTGPDPDATDPLGEPHFLDDAAIDDELLSSVEDVLAELDDIEESDEELFGLQELGATRRSHPRGEGQRSAAFPDIQPVEPFDDNGDDPDGAYDDEPRAQAADLPSGLGRLPTLAVLAANLILLLFAWSASRSLQSGLRDVRDELDEVRTTALAPSATHRAADLRTSPGAGAARPAQRADAAPETAPLPTFDQIALEIAQRELERGLYTAARRRLYGVLALADRIDPERRDDVEARLGFLIADSYRAEAEARREVAQ